jgi:hypothetical protein
MLDDISNKNPDTAATAVGANGTSAERNQNTPGTILVQDRSQPFLIRPDELPIHRDRRQRTIAAIRDTIVRQASITEVELADTIIANFIGDDATGVYDDGNVYRYDYESGIYRAIAPNEIHNIIYDLDRTPLPPSARFKATFRLAGSVYKIICDRVAQHGFFRSAVKGIATQSEFINVSETNIVLQPFDPDQRQRERLELIFESEETCPMTEAFLRETVGEQQVELIFEIMGVALMGLGAKFQRAFILVGDGANGKGVIFGLIRRLIPASALSAVPPCEFLMDYQRVPLAGC